jgi:hypothetical protein
LAVGLDNVRVTRATYSFGAPPVTGRYSHVQQGDETVAQYGHCLSIGAVKYPAAVLIVAAALDESGASKSGKVVGD